MGAGREEEKEGGVEVGAGERGGLLPEPVQPGQAGRQEGGPPPPPDGGWGWVVAAASFLCNMVNTRNIK